jgi:hypothetical protein
MKDMGEVRTYLGINIRRDRNARVLALSQTALIEKLLRDTGLESANPAPTPATTGEAAKSKAQDSITLDYRSVVGSLLYINLCTRPDITAAVNAASRATANPTHADYAALKRIVRYLKGTKDMELVYTGEGEPELQGWSDASFADPLFERRSTTGYCFQLGSDLVTWGSFKQSFTCTSTPEAEYVSIADTAKEAVWLRNFYSEITHRDHSPPVEIKNDSSGAVSNVEKTPSKSSPARQMDVRYNYVKQLVRMNAVTVVHTPGVTMIADIFTKQLDGPKFLKNREKLGLRG